MHFMKGRVYMNRVIEVTLNLENGNDILCFKTDPEISVNLNSESQLVLKKAFAKILEISTREVVTLSLISAPNYENELIKEVCSEYISALNLEIKSVMEEIKKAI